MKKDYIETKRCILRPFKLTDLEDFNEYARMEGLGIHAGWSAHKSIEESKAILTNWLKQEEIEEYAIEYKDNNKVIGAFGIHNKKDRAVNSREMGYVLSKEYWNQGIMSEVAKAMISYAFENFGIELLTIRHYDYNIASRRVIEKAGFKFEGILRKATKNGEGIIVDSYSYSLLKEEWSKIS